MTFNVPLEVKVCNQIIKETIKNRLEAESTERPVKNIVKGIREVNKEGTILNRQLRNQYLHPYRNWRYTIEDAPEMSSYPNFTRVI